jgi:hypothetical protein
MPLPPMPPWSMAALPAAPMMSLFDLSGGLFEDEEDDESL